MWLKPSNWQKDQNMELHAALTGINGMYKIHPDFQPKTRRIGSYLFYGSIQCAKGWYEAYWNGVWL